MWNVAYENLEIYRLADQLAQSIYACVKHWGPFDRDTLGKQIVRAADSVGANIAEGYGRGNGPDQKRILRIARGSVYETKHWLRLAFTRNLLRADEVESLRVLIERLPPKLNAYIRAVGRDRQSTIHNRQSLNGQ